MNAPPPVTQPPEQLAYARWLQHGARVGLALLVLAFVPYLLGWTTPRIAHEQLPALWSLPLADYLERSGMPTGWGWLPLAGHGDLSGLIGIALLAGCALVALAASALVYLRQGDRGYALLCAAQAAVIVLAASGWLTGGH